MKKPFSKLRSVHLISHATAGERRQVKKLARQQDVSVSEWVRRLVLTELAKAVTA